MIKHLLELKNVSARTGQKDLLKDISFSMEEGELIVIIGPNGAGKSTLGHVLIGNPKYQVDGAINFKGENLLGLSTEERVKRGMYLSFQHPIEISGVTMATFLRTSYNAIKGASLNTAQFHKLLKEKMELLTIDPKMRTRFVNTGFSGGEKKRSEMLQLLLFEPELAILDEIDSGLDVDALKLIGTTIEKLNKNNNTSFILITHNAKLLDYISPSKVFILKSGLLAQEGGADLLKEIAEKGFE